MRFSERARKSGRASRDGREGGREGGHTYILEVHIPRAQRSARVGLSLRYIHLFGFLRSVLIERLRRSLESSRCRVASRGVASRGVACAVRSEGGQPCDVLFYFFHSPARVSGVSGGERRSPYMSDSAYFA